MKQLKKMIFGISALILVSCHEATNKFSFNTIKINIEEQQSPIVGFNDIFSEIELIPLETTSKSIIGKPQEFKIFNDNYYIRDSQQNCILVFNKNGKLIFSSKNLIGKGPNEYYNCGHYSIDKKTGNILILDMPLRNITEYNINGDFVQRISFPNEFVGIIAFEILSKNVFAFYFAENQVGKNESITIFDAKENKIIKKIGVYPEKYLSASTNSIHFYSYKDTIIFNHFFPSYSTYFIDPQNFNLIEKYIYNFNKFNFNPNILPDNVDKKNHKVLINDYFTRYAIVINKLENDKYVLVSYFLKHSIIAIYNKSTRKITIKENLSGSKEQLLPPDAIDNQHLYYLCQPSNLNYVISWNLLTNHSKNILKNINNSDNPVIIKYKMKDQIN